MYSDLATRLFNAIATHVGLQKDGKLTRFFQAVDSATLNNQMHPRAGIGILFKD